MRRLWAHILLAFSILFLVGTTFAGIFVNASTNLEYKTGREIVFKLTNKDDDTPCDSEQGLKNIADQMSERLTNSGINAFSIYTAGTDLVKVQFAESNDVTRNNVIKYLSFNGILGLSNMDDNENYGWVTQDEFLLPGGKAYLDDINGYPTVVIPANIDNANFKNLLQQTEDQCQNGIGESVETGETDEEGNPKKETVTYLYLWYDFNEEEDTYSRTLEENAEYDPKIAQKIIMKFDIDNIWYPDGKENKMATSVRVDTDGDGQASYKEISDAYNNARFYVNLLNADELEYEVTQINDNYDIFVNSWNEAIVSNGRLTWNKTLIASVVAIVVMSLLLIVFYRLSALSIISTTLASAYTAIGFMVLIKAEFNIAALIAILLVTLATLACSMLYAHKLKDECYKGRSIKKANSEAGKKALLPTFDINLIVILTGTFVYIFGGNLMRTFSLICIIGGIFSLVYCLLVHRGLMWLATNTTGLIGKYEVFGVEKDKVPDANSITEETAKKEVYSTFADKDFTKKKKTFGIITSLLFIVGLAGIITGSCINKNNIYKTNHPVQNSEIYFETTAEESVLTTNDYIKNNILEYTYVYYDGTDKDETKLSNYLVNTITYTHDEFIEKKNITTTYVICSLDRVLDANNLDAYYVNLTGNRIFIGTLTEVLEATIEGLDQKSAVSVKTIAPYTESQASIGGILLGTGVGIAIIGLYLLIRYRLSRGLTSFLFPLISATSTIGIFALIGLANASLSSSLIIGVPFITAFTFILSVIFMNKEKEFIIDDKTKDDSVENRENIMKKATSHAFAPIIVLVIMSAYLLVDFFGFGPANISLNFIYILLGVVIASVTVVTLYGPISHFIYTKLKNRGIKLSIKPKEKKKKIVKKSSEPEEAVFIGIND